MQLEDLKPGASIRGVLANGLATVVSVQWFGSEALELTYKDSSGKVANELLYRHDEPRLEVTEQGQPWSFDGDGALFRLTSEAQRIHLAHLFDPVLAVHTSIVEPLPHQITAVYTALYERRRLDLTVEALVVENKAWHELFTAGELAKARGRLEQYGYVPSRPS